MWFNIQNTPIAMQKNYSTVQSNLHILYMLLVWVVPHFHALYGQNVHNEKMQVHPKNIIVE